MTLRMDLLKKEFLKEIQPLTVVMILKVELLKAEVIQLLKMVFLKVVALTPMVIQTLKTVKVLEKVQFLKQELLKGKVLVFEVLKIKFRGNKESESSQEDLQSLTCYKTLK